MYELDKAKFGAFVARLRKEMGYTQKELAEQLLISDKAVSKWETGTTIPDTALLISLADILGVTVTELLTGERMEKQSMPPEKVENIVKTVITYTEAAPARAWQEKSFWGAAFVFTCLAEAVFLFLLWQRGHLTEAVVTNAVLTTLFGAYFCFFVQLKLPAYYDQNKISGVHDGVIRMNIPGLHFNNSNWLHIVKTGRLAMIANMVAFPLLSIVFGQLVPELWFASENIVMLAMMLGGLFIPMYIVGKKYE